MKKMGVIFFVLMMTFVMSQGVEAVLLDFETLSDGSTTPISFVSSAQTEYASSGVTFNGGGTVSQPRFRDYGSLSSSIADWPVNNDWFITTVDRTGGGANFDINILFSIPVFEVSGDVIINPGYSMTVSAYDSLNNLLNSTLIPSGAATWIAGSFNFSSGITAIDHINLMPSSDIAAAGLDNLKFNHQVPEPSTILLFSLGLIGLLRYRRILSK